MGVATVNVGGQEVAYLESSGTGRPVLFAHGNSSSSGTWRGMLDGPFGQRYRCLALDLPGHGASAPAPDPATYSLPGYATVLTGFAAGLGASDAVIVGWSLGGHIALEAATAMEELGTGDFTDEVTIVGALTRPLAIPHGEGEQLVNLAFIEQLTIPALWRGKVQVIPGAGHAAHQETPEAFSDLLEQFIADLE